MASKANCDKPGYVMNAPEPSRAQISILFKPVLRDDSRTDLRFIGHEKFKLTDPIAPCKPIVHDGTVYIVNILRKIDITM